MKEYPKIIIVLLLAISTFSLTVYMCRAFHQPSSVVVDDTSSATIMSTVDLQRELNRRNPKLKLKEDGVYGPLTRAAHERAVGNQYALELWPEEK